MTAHFTPYNLNKKSIKNNIIKSIWNSLNENPVYYKIFKNLNVDDAKKLKWILFLILEKYAIIREFYQI